MKINIKNILAVALILFLVVNILVAFDLNAFYIRAVLAFLFIIIVPGMLILLVMRVRKIGFWEYLVYTVGLSISFIMFAGLAVNWILPWLHITDKPLSLWPILICFDIFLLILGFFAYRRNKDLEVEVKPLKLDTTNRIFFIIPMLFPVLSILGALILNNWGPNTLTMIMLGGIAVYVLFLVIFKDKLNENVYPWAIWMIGLSLLLMYSLRSWSISGWDIYQEKYVANLTINTSFWSMANLKDAYNACLSITLLPAILNVFLKVNIDLIFKLILQIAFSLIGIVTFIIFSKFGQKQISFLATMFIIFTPNFFLEMPSVVRQEIALLYFGLFINILLAKNRNKTLLIIFGASLIVSHYSTTYITLISIFLVFIFGKLAMKNIYIKKNYNFNINFSVIFLLLLIAFLWHTQLTNTSSGLVSTISQSITNIYKISDTELKAKGASLSEQFNPFEKQESSQNLLKNYINDTASKLNISILDSQANLRIIQPKQLPLIASHEILTISAVIYNFLKIILKFSIFVGLLMLILYKKISNLEFILYLLIFSVLIVLMITLPILSVRYPLGRFYFQSLLLLAFVFPHSLDFLEKYLKSDLRNIILLCVILIYFLFSTGFIFQIIGGIDPQLNLNNFGQTFDGIYAHKVENDGILWLENNIGENKLIFSDIYGKNKIVSLSGFYPASNYLLPQLNEFRTLNWRKIKSNLLSWPCLKKEGAYSVEMPPLCTVS